jgi:hypothetical protein
VGCNIMAMIGVSALSLVVVYYSKVSGLSYVSDLDIFPCPAFTVIKPSKIYVVRVFLNYRFFSAKQRMILCVFCKAEITCRCTGAHMQFLNALN